MSCDVTNEEVLRGIHGMIVETMPPITGAMNGAMPKVLGSLNLDRIFYDINLDFFILISSITCVVGNVGQANYSTANMYLYSLAAQRKKRGLNASAVNGGAIIGAGYITRETDRALDVTVEKMSLMHLSEEDFYQMIAEAIEAGYPDSANGPEITTRLLDISPDSPHIPKWYSNPKFSRFIVHKAASNEERQGQTTSASIKDQIQACKTRQDLFLLVGRTFGNQLRKFLQASDSVSNDELFSKRAPELGLDSLISVDIRTWFLKNFHVSIPILKIMGNDTMASLVHSVVEAVPAELVSGMPVSSVEGLSKSKNSSNTSKSNDLVNGQTSSSSTTSEHINWEAESTPPGDFDSTQLLASSSVAIPPKLIVLNGATGLLGRHLLKHLLETPSVEAIHCVAVQKLTARLQNKEIPTDSRIVHHEGNLSDPLLGLSEQEADFIFAQADAVVHNGADTSHVKFYSDLRAFNVASTITLTRLCLPRRISIHYISSAGVAIYYNRDEFPEVSVAATGSLYPASDCSFGYGSSKWTNERFLERVYKQYNLSVCLYWPSSIIREGLDATTSQAQLDWVNALLYYTREIKAAPKVEHNHGALDLVRVESCCENVINNVSTGKPKGEIRYVNQVGDVVIAMDQMHLIDADKGNVYDVLPLGEWIKRAVAAGLHPAVALLIQDLDAPNKPDYPKLLRSREK